MILVEEWQLCWTATPERVSLLLWQMACKPTAPQNTKAVQSLCCFARCNGVDQLQLLHLAMLKKAVPGLEPKVSLLLKRIPATHRGAMS